MCYRSDTEITGYALETLANVMSAETSMCLIVIIFLCIVCLLYSMCMCIVCVFVCVYYVCIQCSDCSMCVCVRVCTA